MTASANDGADSTALRLTFLSLLVVSLFVLLFARMWYLQIMAGDQYQVEATGNAVRTVVLDAPRGNITDRHGEPIVRNRYAGVISVVPDEMGDRRDEVLAELADMLNMTVEEIEQREHRATAGPFRPRPILIDVPDNVLSYIHEYSSTEFPGVYAETMPLREYPNGRAGAHLLGYVSEIWSEELDEERYADYRAGNMVGRGGIEEVYESELRGVDGHRRLEVDAVGNVLRELDEELPQPGSDVRLSLDLEIQQMVEEALAEGIQVARGTADTGDGEGRGGNYRAVGGSAIVTAPNGEVLAMASYPDFDPEAFTGGVSVSDYDYLTSEEAHYPLLNRAVQSTLPPGSIFKVVTAAAALEGGFVSTGDAVDCPAQWTWDENEGQQVYPNWDTGQDHGHIPVTEALARSCNTVFFDLARRMYNAEVNALNAMTDESPPPMEVLEELPEAIQEMSRDFGLGEPTGVDLTSDRSGVVPGREWRRAFWENTRESTCTQAEATDPGQHHDTLMDLCQYGYIWRGGDAVNMAIGQGDLQTTPLQMANVFTALANGGTVYEPRVASEIVSADGESTPIQPEINRELPVSAATLDFIEQGLIQTNHTDMGTASEAFNDMPVSIAGKTGTAEYRPRQPIAWYSGYGPAEQPDYIVTVMIEEGGGGGLIAAPVANRIFEGLFDNVEETQITPGEETD